MSRVSLDTAIRLSAEVKGGANITKTQRALQDLAKSGKTTKRDFDQLRAATFKFSRANEQSIAGLRNSISAFRGLQEQAKIGGREFKRYGEEIKRLEGKLKGVDGAAASAGQSLGSKLASGLAAAGIGAAVAGVTRTAASFDAEVRKAAAIEGGGNYDALRKSIEGVAAAAAGTPTQVAQLATALSRAGFTAEETAAALEGIVAGAEATAVSFEEMGSIVSDTMRSFGISTERTTSVVDLMVKTANSSNQSVLDLGEAMKYAAPTARSLGVNIQDLAGTMGVLANNGIRGSEAGTALRTGLNRLQIAASGSNDELIGLTRGSAVLADAMQRLGADVTNADGSLKSMDEVFIAIKRQIESFDNPGQRVEIIKAIFGEEAGGKLRALLNSTEADISKMFLAVRTAEGTAAATRKEMESFELSMKRLGGNAETLTNQIGDMIGRALKPLADGLNAALSASQKLPKPIRDIGAAAAAAGLAMGTLVLGIAALKSGLAVVGGVTALKAALTGAAASAKALGAALLLNPWTAAIAGVVALTAAAYNMNEPFREFVNSIPDRFNVFFRSLGSDISAAVERAANAANAAREAIGGALDWIRERAKSVWDGIMSNLGPVGDAFQALGTKMTEIFGGAFRWIEDNWASSIERMIRGAFPLLEILNRVSGIDVVGAALDATTGYQSGGQRLQAAGSTSTYTVGGVTYDTATGRPVSGTTPFVPRSASAPSMSALTGGSGGGGGAGGGGSAARSFEPSSQARALIAAAKRLGVSPLDLATIISFETGGTFSPSIRGGAGGNYMGLIQFGPPERQRYGAHAGQSFEEQVTGPVVRYFEDRFKGVGMSTQGASLLDLYTTVLAGNPKANRNARDSFGTSASSGVNAMGPHRQKAMQRFFGGSMENAGWGAMEQAEANNAATDALFDQARLREEQLDAAKRMVEETKRELIVNEQLDETVKSIAEAENERYRILEKYKALRANAKSDEETTALDQAQGNELQSNAAKIGQALSSGSAGLDTELRRAADEVKDRLAYEREYGDLLRSGINPELAKSYVEIDRIAAATELNLNRRIAVLNAPLAQLDADSEVRKEIERQIAALEARAGLVRENADEIKGDVAKEQERGNERSKEEQHLRDVEALYESIGGTLTDGLMSGIDALISGTKSWGDALKEIASGVLRDIGSTILRFTLNAALGSIGLPGRAKGGPVGRGEPYVVGEEGPELFVPYQSGTIVPADKSRQIMLAQQLGPIRKMPAGIASDGTGIAPTRSTASAPFTKAERSASAGMMQVMTESGELITVPANAASAPFTKAERSAAALSVPFTKGGGDGGYAGGGADADGTIRFESVVINNQEYVTRGEAEQIGRRSASRGAALAQKNLQNNPKARSAAGI